MKALLIKKKWLDLILSGEKTWELRGSNTARRGEIALIESGTGTIVGTCVVEGAEGPLSLSKLKRSKAMHGVVGLPRLDGHSRRREKALGVIHDEEEREEEAEGVHA